ncbi:hypothetical protein [Chitinilyticum piscinae]|uniref:Uncharacterized protein n=1 Tax=Chitinilyticum piscinae TaxID=2866724 RepID=A0A8J7FYK2_9NEIS|nr:hypothetical protein [Chitinilyticum piscinae]MBE9608063.1 hypothetical protein [Chitinilyticum piscinae]
MKILAPLWPEPHRYASVSISNKKGISLTGKKYYVARLPQNDIEAIADIDSIFEKPSKD